MSNAVYFNSYKLKKATSVPDFLEAISALFKENIANAKGYITSALLNDGETWADNVIMESKNALEQFTDACHKSDITREIFSFMDFNGMKSHTFTLEFNGCFK